MRHAYDVREAAAGTVRLVDRLAEARLVERKTGNDRRSVSLRLTEAGKRQVRSLLVGRQHALSQALGGLDDWERSTQQGTARPGAQRDRLRSPLPLVRRCGLPGRDLSDDDWLSLEQEGAWNNA